MKLTGHSCHHERLRSPAAYPRCWADVAGGRGKQQDDKEVAYGRAGAAEFLASLSVLDIHKFLPKTFLEGPGLVVVLLELEASVKSTGKRIVEEDEVHIWYFDDKNRVTRFRHRVDTQQHLAAYRGAYHGAAQQGVSGLLLSSD